MIRWTFTCVVVAIAALGAGVAAQQGAKPQPLSSPEALLGQALHQEEIDGDLQAAAATYRKVLAIPNVSRDVRQRARTALDRLEQALTRPAARNSKLQSRHVWTKRVQFGAVSPDGRWVSYVDFEQRGNLFLRDLRTGTVQQVTRGGTAGTSRSEYPSGSAFSPDGGTIAYGWKREDGYELRIANANSGSERTITRNPEHMWLGALGWHRAGDRILVKTNTRDNTGQIAWIRLADGATRPLKTMPWATLGEVALSPDGSLVAYDQHVDGLPQTRTIFVLAADGTRQTALTDGTAREQMVGWLPDGSAILFVSYRSGAPALWKAPVAPNGAKGGPATLLRRDIGAIDPLGVAQSGSLFYTTIVSAGAAYVADIDWQSGVVANERKINSNSIADFGADFSPDGRSVAYVSHRGTDVNRRAISVYSLHDGTTREVVPGDDLSITTTGGHAWSPDGKSFLVNGHSAADRATTFAVDLTNGVLTKLLAVPNGYAQVPQYVEGGRSLLYVEYHQARRTTRLFVYDIASRTQRQIEHGFAKAIALGAVASPDGRHVAIIGAGPEMGGVLSVIPIEGGLNRIVRHVDVTQRLWVVGWTPDSRSLIVSHGLRRQGGDERDGQLSVIELDTGATRPLTFAGQTPSSIRVSPDGKRLTYTTAANDVELWSLDGLYGGRASR